MERGYFGPRPQSLVVISSLSHLGQTGGAIICRCRWLTVRIRGTDINGITRQDTGGVAVERDTGALQLQVLAHIDTLCRVMQPTPHRLTDAIDDGTRRVHNKSSACANLCCKKDSDLSCKNDFQLGQISTCDRIITFDQIRLLEDTEYDWHH